MAIPNHKRFISRTVMVINNDVEGAARLLSNILSKEGLFEQYRRTRFHEKPFEVRRRVNYERCSAILHEDMQRRLQFVMRKNRANPFPGCD